MIAGMTALLIEIWERRYIRRPVPARTDGTRIPSRNQVLVRLRALTVLLTANRYQQAVVSHPSVSKGIRKAAAPKGPPPGPPPQWSPSSGSIIILPIMR